MEVRQFPMLLASIPGCLLLAYLSLVLLPPDPVILLTVTVTGCIAIFLLVKVLAARKCISGNSLCNSGIVFLSVLVALVAADVFYIAYSGHESAAADDGTHLENHHQTARYLNQGRLLPPVFYPTESNFYIFKPAVALRGTGFGDFYNPGMLKSERARQELLESRYIEYTIGEHGFRDDKSLNAAMVYALGDSFTFGHGVSGDDTWVRRLETASGLPVFNLGMPGTSPAQHVRLMRYLLAGSPAPAIRHLVWMIYEGNDFTDDFSDSRPIDAHRQGGNENSMLDRTFGLVKKYRDRSIIAQVSDGHRVLSLSAQADKGVDRMIFDGVRMPHPVYVSPRHGVKMFHAYYIDTAGRDKAYYEQHDNRARFELALKDMAELGRLHGFRVTVLIAPTAVSLHAPDFEGVDIADPGPAAIDVISDMATSAGLAVIDLHRHMQNDARQKLLYWRDDSHWNITGNRVVARIIHDELLSNRDH